MADRRVPARGGLPEYAVRVSGRATRVRLSITPYDGLVVIVPRGMEGFDPTDALRERLPWIRASLSDFAEQLVRLSAPSAEKLPDRIEFAATGEKWVVSYRETDSHAVRVLANDRTLRLEGATDDPDACLVALRSWLHRAARARLVPMIRTESDAAALLPRRIQIRAQRMRWGGCSRAGTVTLNRALVFLEAELVSAVMRHELVHLRHPDHSERFWSSLAALDPEWESHRAAIADARGRVPAWAES